MFVSLIALLSLKVSHWVTSLVGSEVEPLFPGAI